MEIKWQAVYEKQTSLFDPHMTLGGKMMFHILTAHLQDKPNHIRECQLSTIENADKVQVTNFTEKRKSHFSNLIWPLGMKWKFRSLIAHLQDKPKHIQEYYLSTLWIVDRVPMTTNLQKTSMFGSAIGVSVTGLWRWPL